MTQVLEPDTDSRPAAPALTRPPGFSTRLVGLLAGRPGGPPSGGPAQRWLRRRGEVLVILAAVLVTLAVGRHTPAGVMGTGVVSGAALALNTLGLVLVFRANRIVNFAQLQLAAVGGVVFLRLVQRRTFLFALHAVCPACVHGRAYSLDQLAAHPSILAQVGASPSRAAVAVFTTNGWLVQLSYWLAAAVALVIAAGLSWLAYLLLIRPFTKAPRLVLTVVTIAAGGFVLQAANWLLDFVAPIPLTATRASSTAPLPITLRLHWGPSVFDSSDVALVLIAVAAAAALTTYLRRSPVGVALRGCAENVERAETLGINSSAVTSRAWLIAGVLAGLSSILTSAKTGSVSLAGLDFLVRTLTAAAAGAFLSLPLAVLGALAIGVIQQTLLWTFSSPDILNGALLVLVVAVLLVQRARASRAESDAEGAWKAAREIRPTPPELANLFAVRRARRWGTVGVATVLLALPWFLSAGQTVSASTTLINAMIGLSLLVLTGWAGQVSLGQLGFAAVGGWTTAMLGWPFPFSSLAAGAAGAVAAVVVGLPSLRLRGLHLAITTLAFGLTASSLLLNPRYLGKNLPTTISRPSFLGLDLNDPPTFYYLLVVLLALSVLAVVGMRRSRTGRALIASKDNEAAAQSFGINLLRARLGAFAISGFMAAVAGSLIVYLVHAVDGASFSPVESEQLFLITIIGGLGSIAGPLLGALYYFLLEQLSTTPLGAVTGLLLGPSFGVIAVLTVFPGGISQLVFGLRDTWLRRLADRHRIAVPTLTADRQVGPGARVPIAPNMRSSGGRVFVRAVYRLPGQWGVTTE